MKLALDTNRYTDLERHLPDVVDAVSHAEQVFLPFIVLAELRYGFGDGARRADNEKKLARFMASADAGVLWPDDRTVEVFVSMRLQLRRQGTPIPDHDIWIAALTLQHGLTLYARDRHYDHLPQLNRL